MVQTVWDDDEEENGMEIDPPQIILNPGSDESPVTEHQQLEQQDAEEANVYEQYTAENAQRRRRNIMVGLGALGTLVFILIISLIASAVSSPKKRAPSDSLSNDNNSPVAAPTSNNDQNLPPPTSPDNTNDNENPVTNDDNGDGGDNEINDSDLGDDGQNIYVDGTPSNIPFIPPVNENPDPTVVQIIQQSARFGGSEFQDPTSYQSKARTWVLSLDLSTTAPDKIIQFYALGCIYYNTFAVKNAWTDHFYGEKSAVPGWVKTDGWLVDHINLCTTWHGIECDANGYVRTIALYENGLTGYLPPETALLHESLTTIDLYKNLLHNQGDFGHSFLGELTNLEKLFYGSTVFEYNGVPTEIGLLTNLREYDMSFSLYAGELTDQPWSSLTNLQYIAMDGNDYHDSSIPPAIAELPILEYFYATDCFLKGGLELIENMPLIKEIWIDDNPRFGGSIPSSIGRSTSLESLSVSNCGLTGQLPSEIGNMNQMINLWVAHNDLSGNVPTEMGNLVNLISFKIQDNDFIGEMPNQVCNNEILILEADCSPSSEEIACYCCSCCGADCNEIYD